MPEIYSFNVWLFIGYGAGLFFLLLNPTRLASPEAFRKAYLFFLVAFACGVAALLANWMLEGRSLHNVLQSLQVLSGAAFVYSLMLLWKAVRGTDLL